MNLGLEVDSCKDIPEISCNYIMLLHRVSLLFCLRTLQLFTPSDMLMDSDEGSTVCLKKNNDHPFPNPCIQRIPFWDITLLRVIGSRPFETKISSWTFRPLKMRQLRFVERSKSGDPLTHRQVPKVRNPQVRGCEKLKTSKPIPFTV